MKKIISCLLSGLLSLTALLGAACSNEKGNGGNGTQFENATSNRRVYENGVHQYNYTQSATDYLVKDGVCEYKIVRAKNADTNALMAAEELRTLFKEATGVMLPIVTDDSVSFSLNEKYISIGENEIFKASGASVKALDLGREGYAIRTVGKSIFITGDETFSDYGTLFGVYGFLELEFNFDCFSNQHYYIDSGVKTKSLNIYDVVDVPDLGGRVSGNGFILNDLKTLRRQRYMDRDAKIFLGSASAHTTFTILPIETYVESNPKWYASSGKQICYFAQGDSEEYAKMTQTIVEYAKNELMNNPDGYIFTIGHEDTTVWCNCEKCLNALSLYKSNAAGPILLCNDIADMIEAWMQTEEGKPYARDFYVNLYAYFGGQFSEPEDVFLKELL